MQPRADTIVAPATPVGESALAIVRASGPSVNDLATACHGGTPPPPRQVWHGDHVSAAGEILDDVVYTYFQAPRSYTGEDVLEISCHGNPLIVRRIMEDLTRRGCRLAEPGEFTRRAFVNGRLDLTAAEAVMDLIRARSDRALDAAQRQLRGALRRRIDGLVAAVMDLSAAVEAHVDFPEEDLPVADREAWRTTLKQLAAELGRLAATRREGDLLRDGVKVVLVGEPNAGKSTLLNRLVGFDRAIVSEEPGTTRDFLEERVSLGGWCIRLFDTAGLREPDGAVERAGVQRTIERVEEADVLLLVTDVTRPCPPLPPAVARRLTQPGVLVAANKCDLPARRFGLVGADAVPVVELSALTGMGLDTLQSALLSSIEAMTAPSCHEEVMINARHQHALTTALASLHRAADVLATSPATDLVAVDLQQAREALGTIVGRIEQEEILDRLFASFCIGK